MGKSARLFIDDKEIRGRDVTQDDIRRARVVFDGSDQSDSDGDDVYFGFSDESGVEGWLGRQTAKEQQAYQALNMMIANEQRLLSGIPEVDLRRLRRHQLDKAEKKSQVFAALMKRRKIREGDAEAIAAALREGDFSMKLYQYANYSGTRLTISSGAYDDLGDYEFVQDGKRKTFDNKTTSYINPDGAFVMGQFRGWGGETYVRLTPKYRAQMSSWWDNRLTSIAYGKGDDLWSIAKSVGGVLLWALI